jgi:hypothetical protein
MLKLSSTSALVLLWARQECYPSENARNYLSLLDLSAGNALYEQCQQICSYYGEVIKNRKFGVFDLINKCLAEPIGIQQIVIAGAGLDALGIEVVTHYPEVTVFELDISNMDIKTSLFSKIENAGHPNIACINADLSDADGTYTKLIDHGWNQGIPTLLIMEGISYYLDPNSIQALSEAIGPDRIIFEFLRPAEKVLPDRTMIANGIFGLIARSCGCPEIYRYDHTTIGYLFGLPVVIRYSMEQLENMRVGANHYFPTEESGWIEVCLLGNKMEYKY